jgi:prepilin-type N-terminal cleavage/methylation domain-containing protein
MHKKNDKGFTLIELLAVVIILIIVLLIAITRVKKAIDKNADNALKANAGSFIKAVNGLSGSVEITRAGELENGLLEKDDLYAFGLSLSGTKPDEAFVQMANFEVSKACLQYGKYILNYSDGTVSEPKKGECNPSDFIEAFEYAYEFTGNYQEFIAPVKGDYRIQLWGASGGKAICNGSVCGTPGNGGYASGVITLSKNDKLYFYVGEKGRDAVERENQPASFNGGGSSTWDNNDNEAAGAGGGATDVRLEIGNLYSRIMVAGGGGGVAWSRIAGAGGGINGQTNNNGGSLGATQTTGYVFGIGKNGEGTGAGDGVAGGGGGYWGGVSYNNGNGEAGSGGSGYISGHTGCVAITSPSDSTPKSGCTDGTTDNECSIHYSNKLFKETVLTAGNESMPTHDGSSTMTGNTGNGYAIITFLPKTN